MHDPAPPPAATPDPAAAPAPLRPAPDAVCIDTSAMAEDAVVAAILAAVGKD